MLPKLKGVHRVTKRLANGRVKVHHYAFRGGPKFWTDPDDGRDGHAYLAAYNATTIAAPPSLDMMIPRLVDMYLDSPEFTKLAPRTQSDYRRWALRFSSEFKDAKVAFLEERGFRSVVMEWRDQWKHSPKQADYAWTVAKRVASWAHQARGLIGPHVLSGNSGLYNGNRAEITWSAEDVALYDQAPDWVRRIVRTMDNTGLRIADLCKLSRAHIKDGRIQVRTNKKSRTATIRITPTLQGIIDETPRDRLLILTNASGDRLTPHRASEGVRQWGQKLGLSEKCALADLRGTFFTRALRRKIELEDLARLAGWDLRYAQQVIDKYAAVNHDADVETLPMLEREQNGKV
ncbi:MAG: tyrosine-type recombinase/integrase [Pseudomonadota bacterium]